MKRLRYALCIAYASGEQYRRNEGRTPRHRVKGECQLNFIAMIKKIPINVEISMLNRKGIYAIDEIHHDGIFQCQIIWSICIDIYRIDDVICRCDVIFVIEIIVAWRKCLTSDLKRSENEKRKTMPTVLYRSKIKWSALFKWCINGISDA